MAYYLKVLSIIMHNITEMKRFDILFTSSIKLLGGVVASCSLPMQRVLGSILA